MTIIKEQYLTLVGAIAKKEGARKVAEIDFDPADRAIDEILRFEISFDDSKPISIPCCALNVGFNVV